MACEFPVKFVVRKVALTSLSRRDAVALGVRFKKLELAMVRVWFAMAIVPPGSV